MPLYDCVMLLKPHVSQEALMDLVARVGKHIYARNGVITNIKKFQNIQLGYGIKKLDGRYYQAQMMQMTMMATPNINKELQYLNKEDRLLRWVLVKSRATKHSKHQPNTNSGGFSGMLPADIFSDKTGKGELPRSLSSLYSKEGDGDNDDDLDDDDDDDEYEIETDETDEGNKEV